MDEPSSKKLGVTIFRAADAPGLADAGCMSLEPGTDVQQAGMQKILEAGLLDGDEIKVLCNIPGFSLTHVWFKAGYPLPLHSHDADCLYYIIAGSLAFGSEDLGPRDSFFIPAGKAYSYTPGHQGVELLEFRHANSFNFLNLAKGDAFWKKAAAVCASNREAWKVATPPTARPDARGPEAARSEPYPVQR